MRKKLSTFKNAKKNFHLLTFIGLVYERSLPNLCIFVFVLRNKKKEMHQKLHVVFIFWLKILDICHLNYEKEAFFTKNISVTVNAR